MNRYTQTQIKELESAKIFDTYMVTFASGEERVLTKAVLYYCYIENEQPPDSVIAFERLKGAFEEENLNHHINNATDLYAMTGAINGMTPAVNRAIDLDGKLTLFVCYQTQDSKVGDRFHYDHGVGIHKNQDAVILWMPEYEQLKTEVLK